MIFRVRVKQERVQSWGWCPQAAAGSGGAQGMEQPEVAASLRIKVLVKFNGQVKVRPKRDSFLGF